MTTILKRGCALLLAAACCFAFAVPAAAYSTTEGEAKAQALAELGLFRGSDKGFELDRAPTRMEALIMLVRMLGAEWDAIYGEFSHPFTDAPGWEDAGKYLGYGYENGLAAGVTATTFDPQGTATAQMYLTFVLRALGYRDSAEGTVWDRWQTLARSAGLLSSGVSTLNFRRGDAVLVTYAALTSAMVDGEGGTLAERLMARNTFSAVSLGKARLLAGERATVSSDLPLLMGAVYAGTEVRTAYLRVTALAQDNLSYYLGLSSLNFTEGLAAEPNMSAQAHSVVLVRVADGVNVEQVKRDIRASVDPYKWVCVGVEPEGVLVESIGNLILLVMDNSEAAAMAANFRALA